MLKLYGFPISNYYNRIKIVLLEKAIPFEEVLAKPAKEGLVRDKSPAGRVPFIEIDGQFLAESTAIFEYLEETYPQTPLLPADPLARARVREVNNIIDLYVEAPARRLYDEAFFGKKVSEETKQEVEKQLRRGVRALNSVVKFSPYLVGDTYTFADVTAAVHLPLVSVATKMIFGKDALEDVAPLKPYLKMLGERPAVAKVNADRKAAAQAAKG